MILTIEIIGFLHYFYLSGGFYKISSLYVSLEILFIYISMVQFFFFFFSESGSSMRFNVSIHSHFCRHHLLSVEKY